MNGGRKRARPGNDKARSRRGGGGQGDARHALNGIERKLRQRDRDARGYAGGGKGAVHQHEKRYVEKKIPGCHDRLADDPACGDGRDRAPFLHAGGGYNAIDPCRRGSRHEFDDERTGRPYRVAAEDIGKGIAEGMDIAVRCGFDSIALFQQHEPIPIKIE